MNKKNDKNKFAITVVLVLAAPMVYADTSYDLAKVINTTLIQAPEILQQQSAVEGAEAAVQIQAGQFDHQVLSSYTNKLNSAPILSYNQSTFLNLTYLQSYQHLLQAGILKQFRNGLSAGFSVGIFRKDILNGHAEASAEGIDLQPTNESAVNFQLTIPLLKGATEESAGAGEKAAQLEYQAAQHDLTFVMSSIVLNAIDAYWDYKVAQEVLESNRISEARVQEWTDKAEQQF
ncbi:MAG: TolC family protein, partial [Methylomonas sp.]|nr:TolC family protein [Methylomonas sp.]